MSANRLTCIKENSHSLCKADRIVGFFLYDRYGEAVGKISALLVSAETNRIEYAVVSLGGFLRVEGKSILIPLDICEVEDLGKVTVSMTQESIKSAPAPHDPENPTSAEEELVQEFFEN